MKNILLIIVLAIGTFSFSQVETEEQFESAKLSADSSEIATNNRIDEEVDRISSVVLLSNGQKEKMEKLLLKHEKKINESEEKLQKRKDKLDKKIRAMLTPAQQEKFDKVMERHEDIGRKKNSEGPELEKAGSEKDNEDVEFEKEEK